MGDKLKNPPLVEALCEFHFDPATPWDWTVPGQLYDRIKGEFPDRAQVQALGLQVQAGEGQAPPVAQLLTGPDRVQLKKPDGSAMVQVGQNLLVVNQLRPYDRWETFRALILDVLEKYRAISGFKEIQRIGLRYINRIELPQDGEVRLESYLAAVPKLHGALDRPMEGFYQRYDLLHEEPKAMLVHQTGLQGAPPPRSIVVDLDFMTREPASPSAEGITAWLDSAHDRVGEAFVDSLNPDFYRKLREG